MKSLDATLGPVKPGTEATPASAVLARLWPVLGFALVALQFGLLVLLLMRFNLETKAFQDVALIALSGFLVHHFLPAGWRLPFFLALSVGATAYVLGLDQGQWHLELFLSRALPLFGIGLALIGICHLPIRLSARVALLILTGAGLAWLRAGWASWSVSGDANWIWPVLGAMFMFRLMIYLYDLQHDKGPVRPVNVLAYFFLLPNVCFTLFPVIDYKTFCRTYYNGEALRIYQRGLGWMTRGIVHLLLWRIVYYEFYIDPSRVASGTDLVSYIVSNMALYLRVSGQFHLVIGLLLLFGFNLPETNRRYFLAAGFTDYWRRVNIYWKDFIMKVFYYPAVFYLKAWGPVWSMVAATVFAFFVTWFLHAYQTFWIRNSFPVKSQDALFWGSLCALVVANSLYEMKKGRKRSLGTAAASVWDNVGMGLRTAGTFLVLSVLWSLWSADSLEQWLELWEVADGSTLLWGAVTLAVTFVAALIVEGSWRKVPAGRTAGGTKGQGAASPFPLREAVVNCMVPAGLLLALTVPGFQSHLSPGASVIVSHLFEVMPNVSDEQELARGYYEDLMDAGRTNPLTFADGGKPRDWASLESTGVIRETTDYRMREFVPSSRVVANGFPLTTNRWGMRDGEYELAKPPGVYRIAMLGSSWLMGLNVADGEPFEAVLEERLNRERAGRPHARYEILNFGVNGYNPPVQTIVLDKKVWDFKPDSVVITVHPLETFFTVEHFAKSLRRGVTPIDNVFREVAEEANIDARTPALRAQKRLKPHWPRLVEWAFRRIADRCREHGIRPVVVILPQYSKSAIKQLEASQLADLARKAGLAVITLENAFGNADTNSLKVAAWDWHPNAQGHKLLADALFAVLTSSEGGLFGSTENAKIDIQQPNGKTGN